MATLVRHDGPGSPLPLLPQSTDGESWEKSVLNRSACRGNSHAHAQVGRRASARRTTSSCSAAASIVVPRPARAQPRAALQDQRRLARRLLQRQRRRKLRRCHELAGRDQQLERRCCRCASPSRGARTATPTCSTVRRRQTRHESPCTSDALPSRPICAWACGALSRGASAADPRRAARRQRRADTT